MWSSVKSWWFKRVIPTLPTLQVITRFLWGLFLVVAILVGFKYLFFTSCLSVGNVKECVTSSVDSSSTLFAIGGILVAIVALIPTFWIEGRIRDAKKEVSQEISNSVKNDMQRLSQAQLLILNADVYQGNAALPIKEELILQAVSLWPAFKQEEYRKLSNLYSEAVREEFYLGPSGLSTHPTLIRNGQVAIYINKAIFYLEETDQYDEHSDREVLVNLACMYGCAGRYDEMIRVIERAIKVDENARDDFQEAKNLALLMRACWTDRQKIEKLGKKIGKELPLSKDEFVRIVKKIDPQNLRGYINFFAFKKHRGGTEEYVYVIKITPVDKQGQISLTGLYLTLESKDVKEIPSTTGQTVSIEDFFDEVDKELFVICSPED
jgi:tetratricopeptide (TPR) repeat protein